MNVFAYAIKTFINSKQFFKKVNCRKFSCTILFFIFQIIVFYSSPKSKAHTKCAFLINDNVSIVNIVDVDVVVLHSSNFYISFREFTFVTEIEVSIYTNKKRTLQPRIKQTIKNQRKSK